MIFFLRISKSIHKTQCIKITCSIICTLIHVLLQAVCELLLKGVQCTHFCAKNMMEGTAVMDAFK